ncbi:hypothetical protein WG915_01750 [Corynebacterium sp. H128]|uniref:hypothetical protein n=1 Tax=Corynebacterium sp. H128 TaxID=3133427 RepID=UPI0030957B95
MMNFQHTTAAINARASREDYNGVVAVVKRGAGLLGLTAVLATAAGCAVSHAETVTSPAHRGTDSVFSSVAGQTTSEVTSAFPSTTTSQVVTGTVPANADGTTAGDLNGLADNAAWSLTLDKEIDGMRLGPLHGSDTVAPLQIGDVMLVGLRSSVLNDAGTAAFSMKDGSLLWQDRSLECQRVDLGGALPCRQNSGTWAPFNPSAAAFGTEINPGFVPEAFGFADGVLYSARTNGAGMIEVAAGTPENPAERWTVAVPRAAEAMVPGNGARIEVADTVKVVMGAAELELSKEGTPLTPEATLAQPATAEQVVDIAQDIDGIQLRNTDADTIEATGTATWTIPSRVVSEHTVTDGKNLSYVSGDDSDGSNLIRTISLATGETVSEHKVIANAAEPRDLQSAAQGLFAYDKQFSTIAYYPAG